MTVRAIVLLSAWTSQQGGMVTAAQAVATGVDRGTLHALTKAGALIRMRHGVYKLCGVPWNRNDEVRAAWLAAEPDPIPPESRRAVVCRQSAAGVYGFGDLIAPSIQVALPNPRRTNRSDVRFYRETVPPADRAWVDDIQVTVPGRIIADLFASGYGDVDHLAAVAVDAVTAGKLTMEALGAACDAYAARFGLPDGSAMARFMWQGYTGSELRVA
jgi:predicted transcriptional regulator of viral defense system